MMSGNTFLNKLVQVGVMLVIGFTRFLSAGIIGGNHKRDTGPWQFMPEK